MFWGFYESAEIRFIEKYLSSDFDVLELGGSIGVVSSHIRARLGKDRRLISVEANPRLIDCLRINLMSHRTHDTGYVIINCAVSYDVESVHLALSDNNTETKVFKSKPNLSSAVAVAARTIESIIQEQRLNDYVMVADIEGSEVEIFIHETQSLVRCKQLFIELHDTVYSGQSYSVNEVAEMIQSSDGTSMLPYGTTAHSHFWFCRRGYFSTSI